LRWHNIRIAPVVLLVRLPIMLIAAALYYPGKFIAEQGMRLPGFTEFP
jgi:hypothetical protein